MFAHPSCLGDPHDASELRFLGFSDPLQAAELSEKLDQCAFTDTGNLSQFRRETAGVSTGAMECHGEAMRLITDLLDEVQDRGESIHYDGLALLSGDINPLLTLGNGSDRLI